MTTPSAITLFEGTSDEITIDSTSTNLVSVPAYRLAELVRQADAANNTPNLPATWDFDAIIRHLTNELYQSFTQSERVCYQIKRNHCTAIVLDTLNQGRAISESTVRKHMHQQTIRYAKQRNEEERLKRKRAAKKRRDEKKQSRALEARRQLYIDYGMQVPTDKRLLAELDQPFKPSKAAAKRHAIEELKRKYGHTD